MLIANLAVIMKWNDNPLRHKRDILKPQEKLPLAFAISIIND